MPKKPEQPKKKMGRPSDYTPEIASILCKHLSMGKSLRTVCAMKGMPSAATVFSWMRLHEDFLKQYARAKEESADAMYEDIQDISDDGIQTIKSGAEKKSGALAQMVRLKVDTRKWMMSKMKPKKYGDKLDLTSDGKEIKGNTINFTNFKKK